MKNLKFKFKLILFLFLFLQISLSYGIYFKVEDYYSWGRMVSLDKEGDFIYTVNYNAFFEIIDVSDPGHPTQVSSLNLIDYVPGVKGRVVVSNTLAFVLGLSYIHVVNVSDPENPVCISVWDFGMSSDIEISGNYAYLAGQFDFMILDISDIQVPQILGTVYGEMDGICIKDNFIYGVVAGNPVKLRLINVEDSQNPDEIIDFELSNYNYGPGGDIGVSGSVVYVVNGRNMWGVDVSNPYCPVITDTILTQKTIYKIDVNGTKALITQSILGIKVIDISNPNNFLELGYYDTPSNAEQVLGTGDIAYIANGYSGLQIIDISDNSNPHYFSSLQTSKKARGFDIKNNYLYLADGFNGLDIVDLSNPSDPTLENTFIFGTGSQEGVSIYNNRLCLSSGYPWAELFMIDISNPGNPVVNYTIDYSYLLFPPISVYQTDNQIFVGAYDTLRIYDVSEFNNPLFISKYKTQSIITDIEVSGNKVFVALGEDGMEIIDIENVTSPQFFNSFNTLGEAVKLLINENALIISDGYAGVQIYDVTNPASPILIETLKPYSSSDVRIKPLIVNDKMIIIDREWNEVFTYSILDVNNIQLLNSIKVNFEIYEMEYFSDLLICTLNDYGLILLNNSLIVSTDDEYEKENMNEFNNISIFPNPAYDQANLQVNLTNLSSIEIFIYNAEGVCSKSYHYNRRQSGNNNFELDLNDLPTGIYLCKVLAGNETFTEKFIKVK